MVIFVSGSVSEVFSSDFPAKTENYFLKAGEAKIKTFTEFSGISKTVSQNTLRNTLTFSNKAHTNIRPI
ncbi:hypothetical protein NC99_20990 [Sunxiuqinia dokdonensis]|uniref:Uncharacterized protein n=1 Tax=Sunxiuqinia dokdonensis TaxID=1409788 RepID=A0A0L8V952_9BACT|nr:hypothetical protein NC99_20990 [Sunxiuqinia dokdonensis]